MELDINELLNFSPLMKTFTFNAWVVAGFTPITRGSTLDYYINRPQGMKGYIINLTLRGQARAKAGDGFLLCRENDLLLFPPGVPHHYGRDEHSEYWDHLWIYFIPRPYWIDWLKWDQTTHGIGKTTINDPEQLQQLRDLFYEVIRHHSASVPLSEALAMNALERLILRCFQQQPISNRHAHDPRINAICDYLNAHIAQEVKIETLAAMVFISLHVWRTFSKMNWGKRSMRGGKRSASTAPGGLFRALRSHLTKLLYRWATAIRSISPACFVNITASHRANIANAMRK